MTENDEPLSAVLAHILEAVFADCETRSDWLTHILDPGVRAAAASRRGDGERHRLLSGTR